ncbi:hypothetical protein Mgra_00006554 [Meloidogyne graminicola]|uniref:Uncharacterized protein n=1 Tax=Meloidogyne graminicola TaxID=189291 RepID=A0A8S9ZKZ3_9BILA|nr:hypothetical protein Mgra_00006554 [Meloidogyne graminicola]
MSYTNCVFPKLVEVIEQFFNLKNIFGNSRFSVAEVPVVAGNRIPHPTIVEFSPFFCSKTNSLLTDVKYASFISENIPKNSSTLRVLLSSVGIIGKNFYRFLIFIFI